MERAAPTTSWFRAAVRQMCPRCRQGKIFHGWAETNERCPACGLVFEREPGYFVGAMYFSYFLSVIFLVAAFVGWYLLFPNLPLELIALLAGLVFLPFVPVTYRYSRVVWLYFDHWAWPG